MRESDTASSLGRPAAKTCIAAATGRYAIATALTTAIAASAVAAPVAEDQGTSALPEVVVHGSGEGGATQDAGKPAAADEQGGYRPANATLGVLGDKPLQDIPASINVINSDLLEDRQITSVNDALKYLPSTQMEPRGGLDVGRPQSRGMEGGVVENTHLDGLNAVATTALPIEAYDRIEVINSLTGAIYGPASPAGDFNMVLKRPTSYYLNKFTYGLTGDGSQTAHVDLGGTPSWFFGYRVNLLKEDGDGYVSGSRINRSMGSLGLDLHPTDGTTVEVDVSYYKFRKYGYPGGFSVGSGVRLPGAFDPTDRKYASESAGNELTTKTQAVKLHQKLGGDWTLNLGYLHQEASRLLQAATNTIAANGSITTKASTSTTPGVFVVHSNFATLNGHVDTSSIGHDLVVGTTGYKWDIVPNSSTKVQNLIVGDTIAWNRQWSTVLSGSYNHFDYASATSSASSLKQHGYSGTAALLFKPVDNLTTYVSYADTLEIGSAVTSTDYANYGEVLDPIRSKQWELGAKTSWRGIDFSSALFRITRPMAFAVNNVYGYQGLQRNYGLELWANGSVTGNLRLFGGVTFLDAILKNAATASNDGKRVVGVPKAQANFLAEYALAALPGVSLNANLHVVGKRAANSSNSSWAAGYVTEDLGAKYVDKHFYGHELTVNFLVQNVTDRKYWAGVFPGSITGASDSATAFLGDPRTFKLQTSISF